MNPQIEIIDSFVNEINVRIKPFCKVTVGQLKPGNNVTVELAPGYVDAEYWDKASIQVLPILILSKHKEQKKAVAVLFDICNYFSTKTDYDSTEKWEITKYKTATTPNFVDREQSGGNYIYSAIINIEFYYEGV